MDEQLARIAEHPEWNVTGEMLEKWCCERNNKKKKIPPKAVFAHSLSIITILKR